MLKYLLRSITLFFFTAIFAGCFNADGNIIIIKGKGKFKSQADEEQELKKALTKAIELKAEIFNINYSDVANIVTQLTNLKTDRGTIAQDARTNKIIVKDIPQVQEGLQVIELILRFQLFSHTMVDTTIYRYDFFNIPANCFIPFYDNNPVLKNALETKNICAAINAIKTSEYPVIFAIVLGLFIFTSHIRLGIILLLVNYSTFLK